MLQISSFPIAPPSLLLLCMYPLPCRPWLSLSMLCLRPALLCYAFALLCFAMPSLSLLCPRYAFLGFAMPSPRFASLRNALAEHCHAMPCDAFALLCRALPCLALATLSLSMPLRCCPSPCHAMPLLCDANLCTSVSGLALALLCKGKFSSLRFGNRYISPFFPRLTQPVGQTFARQNQTAQPLLSYAFALLFNVSLRNAFAMYFLASLCLCIAPQSHAFAVLCSLKAMPLLC